MDLYLVTSALLIDRSRSHCSYRHPPNRAVSMNLASFTRDIDVGVDIDVDTDIDSYRYMAVSKDWGSFKGGLGAPLERFGVDMRQA